MFNLDEYEDVASLNIWLNENFPMNRVDIEVIKHDPDKGFIMCKARIWRDLNDEYPSASNIAFGSRDQYNRNIARFYCEDVATSAIGRAIIILKGSQKTATKESMVRVAEVQDEVAKVKAKMADTSKEYVPVPVESDPWNQSFAAPAATMEQAVEMVKSSLGAMPVDESCIHGARIWKTGTSKAGKPWGHWKCSAAITRDMPGGQVPCDPIWYDIDKATGKWQPQVKR
jgi:hypothetical protein